MDLNVGEAAVCSLKETFANRYYRLSVRSADLNELTFTNRIYIIYFKKLYSFKEAEN